MTRPLRVLVDARMLIGRFSGVGRVVTRLVDHLTTQNGLKVFALCGRTSYPPWSTRTDIEVVPTSFDRGHRTPLRRLAWEETHLRRLIRRIRPDVYHATWNTGIPAACGAAAVLTVHDLIPWSDPSEPIASRLQRLAYRYAVRTSVRRACVITTVSHHVRRQVLDRLRVHPQRVVAILNGVDAPPPRPTRHEQAHQPPFVLYVGGAEPRKNLATLFRAMESYWRRFSDSIELRLTGQRDRLDANTALALASIPHHDRIHFLGGVDDQELGRLYRSARALMTLSRDEGFGLPVLEAMAHGCPVVASDIPAHVEAAGGAAALTDAMDADGAALALHSLLDHPADRKARIEQGLNWAAQQSWTQAALRFRRAYELASTQTMGSALGRFGCPIPSGAGPRSDGR